ncbi:hypothetical protein [Pseudomonas schmalbachii]|uniref:Uncharacterized protein n=1 Tax=Pseudomonas schmalbachii TaxID=2816993 RepID=A0ABS3TKJ2_9PSED|nr:hypothetical protein [Pseudomonas schmalbachii]MBO3274165.1 hypothetical protein [Pseudomonas schmalbachii]
MKNKIEDLRNHLFATIEGLLDPDKPLDIERAKAVAQVSQQLIESAKVEVKFLEVTGAPGTGFIEPAPALPAPAHLRSAGGGS